MARVYGAWAVVRAATVQRRNIARCAHCRWRRGILCPYRRLCGRRGDDAGVYDARAAATCRPAQPDALPAYRAVTRTYASGKLQVMDCLQFAFSTGLCATLYSSFSKIFYNKMTRSGLFYAKPPGK